ncbi:MAG: sugar phosphate isomerase/epimerase [Deltaproteobacteria bacterium]|nr:sugar phosphate isomerase/epimerase [Deltaproteobacteria bacterium]
MYPFLPKSYKNTYPFKLAAPSFIYPDNYIPNIKMLGPCLDEIELLIFESAKESLPSEDEIRHFALLAKEFDLTYNVHLPLDIFLGDQYPSIRHQAVESIKHVFDLTAPLSPSTLTLHLSYDEASNDQQSVAKWQERVHQSMQKLLATGINSRSISIETLMYPFEWADPIINDLDLSVCIDIGHLILQKADVEKTFNAYLEKTSILHLHGADEGRDHMALDKLPTQHLAFVMEILQKFTGVVSLEVFSYRDLIPSLKFFEKCWQRVIIS